MPNPFLAQRYAEWAVAEAAVIEAQNDPGGVDAEALAPLKADRGACGWRFGRNKTRARPATHPLNETGIWARAREILRDEPP